MNTTTTTNEAAERLLTLASNRQMSGNEILTGVTVTEFREALAAERRATVERIDAGLHALMWQDAHGNWVVAIDSVALILDEEAAR